MTIGKQYKPRLILPEGRQLHFSTSLSDISSTVLHPWAHPLPQPAETMLSVVFGESKGQIRWAPQLRESRNTFISSQILSNLPYEAHKQD